MPVTFTETVEFRALVLVGLALPAEPWADDTFDVLVSAVAGRLGLDRTDLAESVNDTICETALYPNGRAAFVAGVLESTRARRAEEEVAGGGA